MQVSLCVCRRTALRLSHATSPFRKIELLPANFDSRSYVCEQVEFHRDAYALIPEAGDAKSVQHLRYAHTQMRATGPHMVFGCSCEQQGRNRVCPHQEKTGQLVRTLLAAVPGYLGLDPDFRRRFVDVEGTGQQAPARAELRRLLAPFVLRRLKETVLTELPEKIEDIRHCPLSTEQAELYRQIIAGRAGELTDALRAAAGPVPYLHIFSVLNLLKRACDHPALVQGEPETYQEHQSGKWDLFTEILGEALDSGQKVVVFSQYLEMLRIMELHLIEQGIGHVKLTGQSINRGALLKKFNEEPECRVFLGSLQAGGTGIDLIAASVVIHYDRWWNAARENQATDRVHRMGQTRGVSVFKFVSTGTLEEKIAAIIERKRELLGSVVTEDDPNLMKSFGREELLELLQPLASFG